MATSRKIDGGDRIFTPATFKPNHFKSTSSVIAKERKKKSEKDFANPYRVLSRFRA